MQAAHDDFDASSENWNSHIYAFRGSNYGRCIEARSSERNQLSTYLIQNSEEVRAVVAAAATHSNRIIQQKEEEKIRKRGIFLQRLI